MGFFYLKKEESGKTDLWIESALQNEYFMQDERDVHKNAAPQLYALMKSASIPLSGQTVI